MAEKLVPWKVGGIIIRLYWSSVFIDNYKSTNVGFALIQDGKQQPVIPTFESSTTTLIIDPMAYTSNVNYNNYRPVSKINPRLKQLAILSLVVLVGMMVSIFVNA